jgi:predicted nucleic acid-binding protein
MNRRPIVLDANILIRGVFGVKVRNLLKSYEPSVVFVTPDVCFEDARRHVSWLAGRHNMNAAAGLSALDQLAALMQLADRSLYEKFETASRKRISPRDPDDWPILAASLSLNCPIWTEDRDFFGTGVATWTTNNIPIFLSDV